MTWRGAQWIVKARDLKVWASFQRKQARGCRALIHITASDWPLTAVSTVLPVYRDQSRRFTHTHTLTQMKICMQRICFLYSIHFMFIILPIFFISPWGQTAQLKNNIVQTTYVDVKIGYVCFPLSVYSILIAGHSCRYIQFYRQTLQLQSPYVTFLHHCVCQQMLLHPTISAMQLLNKMPL